MPRHPESGECIDLPSENGDRSVATGAVGNCLRPEGGRYKVLKGMAVTFEPSVRCIDPGCTT